MQSVIMGVYNLYMQGNAWTGNLTSYVDALTLYFEWWNQLAKESLVENLNRLLLLVDDETSTEQGIIEFRQKFGLNWVDDITLTDIARFKSLSIYTWLYTEYSKQFIFVWGRKEIESIISTIENVVLTAVDVACTCDFLISTANRYNTYISAMIRALAHRIDTHRPETHIAKRKFFAVMHIQKCWKKCITDPDYLLCRRRLMREYHEMDI